MDTVQSQVLCALQQAANETFDNLKKDAAHRILMAEKRAMELEHELSMVKQHALTMLLRLKTNNDAKVSGVIYILTFEFNSGFIMVLFYHLLIMLNAND